MSDLSLLQGILAKPLTEVADLPEFVTPPPGTYRLLVSKVASKVIGDKPAVSVEYTVLQTIELADKDDKPLEPGAMTGEAFFFGDESKIETALSVMKSRFGALAEPLGLAADCSVLELLDKLEGVEIQCTIGNRADKNDKTKLYSSFRDLMVAA